MKMASALAMNFLITFKMAVQDSDSIVQLLIASRLKSMYLSMDAVKCGQYIIGNLRYTYPSYLTDSLQLAMWLVYIVLHD